MFLYLTAPAMAQDLGRSGFVDSSGVKIHYMTAGDGPLLVLIHGFPDFWYTWRAQMPELAKHYQVVAIDQRGYNESDHPEGVDNYSVDKLVGDVLAVIAHFGRERATIVGHDWGGFVAWTLAMRHPERVERLVILNLPHPRGLLRELARNPEQQQASQYARDFLKPDAARALNPERLAFWVKDEDARKKYLDAFQKSSIEAMLNYYKANYPRPPYQDDETRTFPRVTCPVLMIHGLKDNALLPGALNDTWKWLDSELTLVTIPEAGHFVQQDAADRVTRILVSWLAQSIPDNHDAAKVEEPNSIYRRDNLVAWCIVPFDSKRRGPEERAAMLQRLGFKRFAYDWRAEHIPTFDAEIEALKRHGISLDAFWVAPGELNQESRIILDVLKRHGIRTQLWVLLDLGADRVQGDEQRRRVETAAAKLRPLAEEAGKIGCTLALYNHGGWFGEPENQIAIIERLKSDGVRNLGLVYNLHHGHDHLDRFPALLETMKPYLLALNINGMDRGGDRVGRKILPLGQGEMDLSLLKTIRDSGYQGPIGILGHTQDDAEERLKDNLDGLDWLLPQLDGRSAGPRPTPRTPVPPRPETAPKRAEATPATDSDAKARREKAARVSSLIQDAQAHGDFRRGAEVFASQKYACLTCHRVGHQGGEVGPELSTVGVSLKPDEIVAAVLWPRETVKDGYSVITVATEDGKLRQGYRQREDSTAIVIRDPASGEILRIEKAEIDHAGRPGRRHDPRRATRPHPVPSGAWKTGRLRSEGTASSCSHAR